MNYWHRLSIDEAEKSYRIPRDVASDVGHSFYGAAINPFDSDGPWPLLAFMKEPNTTDNIIFQIYNIFPETLDQSAFNPLSATGGSVYLRKQALIDLISLLNEIQWQLPESDSYLGVEFELLNKSDTKKYRLTPELFPNSNIEYFRQIKSPHGDETGSSTTTILFFSTSSREILPQILVFRILQFNTKRLQETSFNPLNDSNPRLILNRPGVVGLIELLSKQLAKLEGN